jgi:hypothetical protein
MKQKKSTKKERRGKKIERKNYQNKESLDAKRL